MNQLSFGPVCLGANNREVEVKKKKKYDPLHLAQIKFCSNTAPEPVIQKLLTTCCQRANSANISQECEITCCHLPHTLAISLSSALYIFLLGIFPPEAASAALKPWSKHWESSNNPLYLNFNNLWHSANIYTFIWSAPDPRNIF